MFTNELLLIIQTTIIVLGAWAAYLYGLRALTALITLYVVLANFLVVKQICVASMCITATDAYAIGAGIGLSLLQFRWSRKEALQAIAISFAASCLVTVLTQLHLLFTPTAGDWAHIHYAAVLSTTPRIVAASLISYLCCQLIETSLLAILRAKTRLPFEIQGWFSVIVSSAVDTVLFSILGLYGLVENLTHIIVISYAVKLAAACLGYVLIAVLNRSSKFTRSHKQQSETP